MVNIFVTSDTHFGHANIIKFCSRPFDSVEQMDEVIIDRWNKLVMPQDHVYHLGDVSMSQVAFLRCVPRLNGHLRLILGNHDNQVPMKTHIEHFDKILMWRLFKPLIFTHVPIHQASFGKAQFNVHGHIHEKPAYGPEYLNMCVEQTDYTPVHIDTICKQLGVKLG